MGTLPPQSSKLIPQPLRYYMLDEQSSIKDYYPKKFEIDMNGKKMNGRVLH